jgi:hypothetical protein
MLYLIKKRIFNLKFLLLYVLNGPKAISVDLAYKFIGIRYLKK